MSDVQAEGSQPGIQILIKSIDKNGEEVIIEAGGAPIMGRRASFYALVNGKQIPVGDFLKLVWTVAGNTQPYAAIVYQPQLRHVAEADLNSYPLLSVLLPIVRGLWSTTATLELAGELLDTPIPRILSSRPFPVMSPGRVLSTVTTVYGTAIKPYVDASGRTFIGMTNDQAERGARVDCTYEATWSDTGGKLQVVQLANVYLYVERPGIGKVYDTCTKGEYWFDGSDFPYMEVAIPGRGKNTISWWDTPGVFFTDNEKDVNLTIGWKGSFRTYFFYQDNAPQSAPLMVGFPLQWGATWKARWNGTSIGIFDDHIDPLTTYESMIMPTWNNYLPNKPTSVSGL